ncbi:hypothetical protein B0H11DRAFT_2341019 [Mycena galericulata]|nr:hypothetical protein B0H11DRAFT_2341019 [Mycena galericulata]
MLKNYIGSSVLEAILKDGTFIPRAITRNPESEASLKLKARGIEVVKADTGDKASLVGALHGSEAVFAVTLTVWRPSPDAPTEIEQGKNIVDACKEVGTKFVIFSSVPGLTKLSGGKYTKVFAYDDKEVIQEYLEGSGLANASLFLGGFMENLWTRQSLKKTASGFDMNIANYSPSSLAALTWVQHDVGESALALLKNYTDHSKSVSGRSYPVVTASMTYPEFASKISKVLNVEITTSGAATGMPALDELFAAQSEYNGLYTATQVPNPDLVGLGAKFGTVEEFMDTEVKKRFGGE